MVVWTRLFSPLLVLGFDSKTVQRSAFCRSRRELSNACLLAKIGFATAEHEPSKVFDRSPRRAAHATQGGRGAGRPRAPEQGEPGGPRGPLAGLSSFGAASARGRERDREPFLME